MTDAATATAPSPEDLMELAQRFLNDQGQVEVSILIDDGDIRRSQAYLLGAIDKCLQKQEITEAEAPEIFRKLGFTTRDIERLRSDNLDRW